MIVTVQELGKWGGIKVNGEYVTPSKFVKGLPDFVVGKTYDIEIKENVSKKDGKTYKNIVAAKEVNAAPAPAASKPAPAVEKKTAKKDAPAKAVAFGRELSDYEILKDKRIGVAGVVQALLQSTVYTPQIELMEPAKVDEFLAEKAAFWVKVIKGVSEE